jgi:hypothetical protein
MENWKIGKMEESAEKMGTEMEDRRRKTEENWKIGKMEE